MSTHTETRTAGRRITTKVGALVAAGVLLVGLSACQTPTAAERSADTTKQESRPAAVVPQGIDTTRSADRIAEDIERRQAERGERYAGVPADRIEEMLAR
ncbi:hypothetical protein LG299_03185 [Microbacterium lacus]|uniref:hypothetical protein n=1 Tax=Microbacterium lacus TaxID=415217 RepID=UPI00384CD3A6